MRLRSALAIAVIAAAIGAMLAARWPLALRPASARGVHLLSAPSPEPRIFDPAQSAAFFLGVRHFTNEDTLDVDYAADDAVDLAYAFALGRVALVRPSRVVIALSGRPQKDESKKHLEELVRAGARVEKASPSDILMLLQRQAALAGREGMFILSIATHGFTRDGVPYILGSTSLFRYPETALPLPKLFEIVATSEAPRSLLLIDACRERITDDARAGASPDTAAPVIDRMKRIHGQVVLYAAAAGGYAYDGDGNGVFTKAVLDGLHCQATPVRGTVTVKTLQQFVERTVRRWIRAHGKANVAAATQVSMDGDSGNMPLCTCAGPPPPPPPADVARATHDGSTVTAYAADGMPLWSRKLGERIARVEVADLHADGSHEVIVGAAHGIHVFDRAGTNTWSATAAMALHMFVIDHLLRHDPSLQIAVAWNDERVSRSVISTYNADGERLAAYNHHGRVQRVAIDRPTSRHNRRIIAIGTDENSGAPVAALLMLSNNAELLWKGVVVPATERLVGLDIANHDKYSREIILSTKAGETIHLDFDGTTLESSSGRLKLQIVPRNTPGRSSW